MAMNAMPMIARCMRQQNPDIWPPPSAIVQREEPTPPTANEYVPVEDTYIPHA